MFGGEESDKKVKVLSGGERTRLAMIKLLLEPVNLLILDEPTNHLDMRSKDVLKEAIRQFNGTVIVVSHDRDFLDGLVSRVYEFANGRVREHLGGIYDYLKESEKREVRSEKREVRSEKRNVSAPSNNSQEKNVSSSITSRQEGRMAFEAQKAQARQRKKAEKAIVEAEQAITELEQAISILEARMATPEGGSDMSLYEKHGNLKQQLAKAEDEWAEAMEALEGGND